MNDIDLKRNRILYFINLGIEKIVEFLMRSITILFPFIIKKTGALESHKQTFVNVFGLTGLNALGGCLLLLTQVKLANSLGASTFGVYSYCLAIGEVGAMIVRYGRNKTMTRDLIQRPERRTFLIVNTFALSTINFLLFMGIVMVFHNQLDVELTWAYLLLIAAPCLVSLDFHSVYEAMRLMSWHSIYNLIQKVLFLITVWSVIVLFGKPSLLFLGIALFSSWIVILLMQMKEIGNTINDSIIDKINYQNILHLYRENFVIALSTMFGVAFGPLLRMILKQYSDSTAVGIYSAGLQIFLISQFIMHQVARVGNPIMAEIGKEGTSVRKQRAAISKYLTAMMSCTIPFAIPLIFFPHALTHLFFTEEYATLGNYLPIFAFYLITLAIGVVFTQYLISKRKDKVYFALYIGGSVLTIVMAYITIPSWGVFGAVFSLCVPHGVTCIAYALASVKYLR